MQLWDEQETSFNPALGLFPLLTLPKTGANTIGVGFNPALGLFPLLTVICFLFDFLFSCCFNPALGLFPLLTIIELTEGYQKLEFQSRTRAFSSSDFIPPIHTSHRSTVSIPHSGFFLF